MKGVCLLVDLSDALHQHRSVDRRLCQRTDGFVLFALSDVMSRQRPVVTPRESADVCVLLMSIMVGSLVPILATAIGLGWVTARLPPQLCCHANVNKTP